MATRLYFASTTAGEVTPVANGAWGFTSEALVRKLVNGGKSNTALAIGAQIGPWTAGQSALDRRYVSAPLEAQTINGTVAMQLMTREYATADNTTSRLEVYVVSRDGQTVRGTLLAINQYGPATEYVNNVTHRNKTYADGDAIGAVVAQKGDRIVVCVGHTDAAGSTPEGSCKFGDPTGTADLPVNETQTTDGVGWIEFSGNLVFEPPAVTITPSKISSPAAVRTPVITLKISSPKVPSAVAVRVPQLATSLATTKVAGSAAVRTPSLHVALQAARATSGVVRTPALREVLQASHVASGAAVRTLQTKTVLLVSKVASSAAVYDPNIQGGNSSLIEPDTVISAAAVRLPTLHAGLKIPVIPGNGGVRMPTVETYQPSEEVQLRHTYWRRRRRTQ